MIYLDSAATSLYRPPQVKEAVLKALGTLTNSSRGSYESALDSSRMIYNARVRLAEFFNCKRPDHVIFTSGVTEALNTALYGLLERGDHVISTDLEHNSVLRPLYQLEATRGVNVDFVPADKQGLLDIGDFERLMRPETKLVVCTHASNLTGNVLDIGHISEIVHAHKALLVVDTAQTAGSHDTDMQKLGADVLCFTGHKGLMGPQGTGGLCIKEGIDIKPLKAGGTGVQTYSRFQPSDYPVRLEAGTLNGHGIAGLSAGVEYIQQTGLRNIGERIRNLTMLFYKEAALIPGIRIYGDFSKDHAGIVALNIKDADSGEVSDILSDEFDTATRSGAHCAPRMHEALGTKAQGAVRFSFSYFNTEAQIREAVRALKIIAKRMV